MDKKVFDKYIVVYENAIPLEVCSEIIAVFNEQFLKGNVESGYISYHNGSQTISQQFDNHLISLDLFVGESHELAEGNISFHQNIIMPVVQDYFASMRRIDEEASRILPETCIISKYEKGKGFFAPHKDTIEEIGYERAITIICYFNTVEVGGETYFFNQELKISPTMGSILIFPSNFVYAHEGLIPESHDKYISVTFATVGIK